MQLFSAPGEGRECLEIARRILACAADGVRFDGIASCPIAAAISGSWNMPVREPDPGVVRSRLAGQIPPGGAACAAGVRDGDLSARRFAEYLSLGQVPTADESRAAAETWAHWTDEQEGEPSDDTTEAIRQAESADAGRDGLDAIASGTLRAPWQWEHLLIDSKLIHYRDRWHRRLRGLDAELARKLETLIRDEPESPRIPAIERERVNLSGLRDFALPLVDELAGWPERDLWAAWLARLHALVPRVLRRPTRVLRVLSELTPLADVGPVTLREVSDVLAERLRLLAVEPPNRRYGRVFVGSPHQARGRSFRVVFLPGLAERLFPRRPHEDPLLLDERRAALGSNLPVQSTRGGRERLLLQLAAGAATERVYVSFPSLELGESRPRVPSFYALDVMRAVTGTLPSHEELAWAAAAASGAASARASRPREAIDDLEHDLAVLRLFRQDGKSAAGHAHYLLKLNFLRLSVIDRWSRSQNGPHDGIVRATDVTRPLLDERRLTRRAYSLSALQHYAACLRFCCRPSIDTGRNPAAAHGPLTRGSLFHRFRTFFRSLAAEGRLCVCRAVRTR